MRYLSCLKRKYDSHWATNDKIDEGNILFYHDSVGGSDKFHNIYELCPNVIKCTTKANSHGLPWPRFGNAYSLILMITIPSNSYLWLEGYLIFICMLVCLMLIRFCLHRDALGTTDMTSNVTSSIKETISIWWHTLHLLVRSNKKSLHRSNLLSFSKPCFHRGLAKMFNFHVMFFCFKK